MSTIEELQAQVSVLSHRLAKMEAADAIRKVMATYQYRHYPEVFEDKLPLFALEMPDVSVEIDDAGIHVGEEGVRHLFLDVLSSAKYASAPMFIHTLTTEYIEVAEDLKSAKCVWTSPGVETYYAHHRHTPEECYRDGMAPMQAYWCWGRYTADFIEIGGCWKIWHLKWWRDFRCDYYKSWVDDEEANSQQADYRKRSDFAPVPYVHACRYHNPYRKGIRREPLPALPAPYQRFDDSDWIYGDYIDKLPPKDY